MDCSENIFAQKYKVRAFDTSANNKASFIAIAGYMQDTALHHVLDLKMGIEQLLEKNITWLLSRIKIKVNRYPKWNEYLTVQTWSPEVDRLYAHREFSILDQNNNTIAFASSLYVLLDLNTLKPLPTQHVLKDFNQFNYKRGFPEIKNRIKISNELKLKKEIKVTYDDIDLNDHVNNLKYINWIMESFPVQIRKNAEIDTFEINYQNSAMLGDTIKIFCNQPINNELHFEHCLKDELRDTFLVLAKTHWKQQ